MLILIYKSRVHDAIQFRIETRENCLPCHQTQFSDYSGTAPGAGISDVMFDSGVDCRGCHLDQSGQITRPGPKTCLNCHEEGYDEMLSEWQFNTTAMIQEIESLLARLETAGPGQPDKKILSTARTALDLFTRDGSKGAHNNLLAEEYLGEVLDNLKKLMPSS